MLCTQQAAQRTRASRVGWELAKWAQFIAAAVNRQECVCVQQKLRVRRARTFTKEDDLEVLLIRHRGRLHCPGPVVSRSGREAEAAPKLLAVDASNKTLPCL